MSFPQIHFSFEVLSGESNSCNFIQTHLVIDKAN